MSERDTILPLGYETRRTVILTSIPCTLPDGSLMLDPTFNGNRLPDGSPIEDVSTQQEYERQKKSRERRFQIEEVNRLLWELANLEGNGEEQFGIFVHRHNSEYNRGTRIR